VLHKNHICDIICDIPKHMHRPGCISDYAVMAIRARCDIRAEKQDYSTNRFRKAAYRQYFLWRCKKLGRGNRKVPSCVVLAIRHLYPANDGVYVAFKRT
jgi:P2X purinoceptor 7